MTHPRSREPRNAFCAGLGLDEHLEFTPETIHEHTAKVARVDVVEGFIGREDPEVYDEFGAQGQVRESRLQQGL